MKNKVDEVAIDTAGGDSKALPCAVGQLADSALPRNHKP